MDNDFGSGQRDVDRDAAAPVDDRADLPIACQQIACPSKVELLAFAEWKVVNGADVIGVADVEVVIPKVRFVVIRVLAAAVDAAEGLRGGARLVRAGGVAEASRERVLRLASVRLITPALPGSGCPSRIAAFPPRSVFDNPRRKRLRPWLPT